MTEERGVQIYKDYPGMFFSDFWNAGNTDLNIAVSPRENVQSGRWFEATWTTAKGEKRYVSAQWQKLVMERIYRQFLQDDRKY